MNLPQKSNFQFPDGNQFSSVNQLGKGRTHRPGEGLWWRGGSGQRPNARLPRGGPPPPLSPQAGPAHALAGDGVRLRAERRAPAHAGRALGGPGSEKCRCPSKDISVASKCWQL